MTLKSQVFHSTHSSIISSCVPTPIGTCGNCGDRAMNPLEHICVQCAEDYSLSTFPTYIYPSEMLLDSHDAQAKRAYFIINQ